MSDHGDNVIKGGRRTFYVFICEIPDGFVLLSSINHRRFSVIDVAVEVLGVSTRVGHRTCTRASLHVRHTRSLRGR